MAMVVRSNIMALNANRQLGMNSSAAAKSLEKLSSGFRINRAGDDASGLAISEKMKAQIKGLEQASSNSQDGISLVQTAEGAMTEVHNMLNRMVELATKSSNGTMADDVDREAIQDEVDQLLSEIDRIGDATNFNGINLLDGTMAAKGSGKPVTSITGTANGGTAIASVAVTTTAASKFKATAVTATTNTDKFTLEFVNNAGKKVSIVLTGLNTGNSSTNAANIATKLNAHADFKAAFGTNAASASASGKVTITSKKDGYVGDVKTAKGTTNAVMTPAALASSSIGIKGRNAGMKLTIPNGGLKVGDTLTVGGKTYTMGAVDNSKTNTFKDIAGLKTVAAKNGVLVEGTALTATTELTFTQAPKTGGAAAAGELTLQVGDTNDKFNKVTVKVDNVKTDGLSIKGLDVSTQTTAGAAIQTVKDAINKVSTNRGTLGALQNRLEYAINNLDVTAENMNGANSRIRDTDMAKEMMSYTKMNVLTQSAQAMLAQANQQPQSILQLLQ